MHLSGANNHIAYARYIYIDKTQSGHSEVVGVGKSQTGVWDYTVMLCCLIMPFTGLMLAIGGALCNSVMIIIVGIALFVIPLLLVWAVISIKDSIGRKRHGAGREDG